jgi:ceramide glucosyltransferase
LDGEVTMHGLLAGTGLVVGAAAATYAVLTALASAIAATRPRRLVGDTAAAAPAVSVLKPLCGHEYGLYEQLRSVCVQNYPDFQIVLGLQNPQDSALPAVRLLKHHFDAVDIDCVIDATRHGANAKVSNLINMLPHCRHELLIMADSDIEVPPDYLERVLAPLDDPRVGLVTCPYIGRARCGLWSALGAMFINDWFMPNVRLAALFGSQAFVSGATIAMRRAVLERSGGLAALCDQLADDYQLGIQVRALGLSVAMSELAVDTLVDEPSLAALCEHTSRWLRTIRSVRPGGYACCFITFSLPMALLGAALAAFAPMALILLGITVAARLVLHFPRHARGWRQLVLIPLHDALLLTLWCCSFRGREVSWRRERFGIGRGGSLHRIGNRRVPYHSGEIAE